MHDARVLVTDGAYKHTLAAVRSLRQKGLKVTVTDRSVLAQSFYSRYCNNRYLIKSRHSSTKYLFELRQVLKHKRYDALIPISWYANYHIARNRKDFDKLTNLAIAKEESMEIAANKDKTMKFAAKLGVNIPTTFTPCDEDELLSASEEMNFPIVIKSSADAGIVLYPKTIDELLAAYRMMKASRPIIQEYIRGYGCGFFALYDNGHCIAFFMHRRLREYPVSGGPSTAAISYYSPELLNDGKKLLDNLKWHGIAMVEFKRSSKDGKYYLMEVNPKFWGSLDLAIASGVDFPYLLYNLIMGYEFEPVYKYRLNVKFRWPFPGDFLNALYTRRIRGFFRDFLSLSFHTNIQLNDPLPLLYQILATYGNTRQMRLSW